MYDYNIIFVMILEFYECLFENYIGIKYIFFWNYDISINIIKYYFIKFFLINWYVDLIILMILMLD